MSAQDYQKGYYAYQAGDYAKTLKELHPLAEQGLAEAQFILGGMYLNGRGVPQDYDEAVKWFRLAAEKGNASAQADLGGMYATRKGVPQDNIMAHMWYNLGAANGHKLSGTNRDEIAKQMTPAAIEKAQAMALECISSGYMKCGH